MQIGYTMGRDLRYNRDDDDEDFGRRNQSFRRREQQRDRKFRERDSLVNVIRESAGVANGAGRSER